MDELIRRNRDREVEGDEPEVRGMPILVLKDSATEFTDENVVPQQGECGFATKCGAAVLDFPGYTRINFKTGPRGGHTHAEGFDKT